MNKTLFIASNISKEPCVAYTLGMGVVRNALMDAGQEAFASRKARLAGVRSETGL